MIQMDCDAVNPGKTMFDSNDKTVHQKNSFIGIIGYVIFVFLLGLLLLFVQLYLPIGFELLIIMLLFIVSKTSVFMIRQRKV